MLSRNHAPPPPPPPPLHHHQDVVMMKKKNDESIRMHEVVTYASSPASAAAQTRFSFYNAEDFQVKRPDEISSSSSSSSLDKKNSDHQFSLFSSSSSSMLRSLHVHEKNRVELRQARQEHGGNYIAASMTTTAAMPPRQGAALSSSSSYEDAIKEALELLKKHRVTDSPALTTCASSEPQPQQQPQQPLPASNSTVINSSFSSSSKSSARAVGQSCPVETAVAEITTLNATIPSNRRHLGQQPPLSTTKNQFSVSKTPRELDKVLQSRGDDEEEYDYDEDVDNAVNPPSTRALSMMVGEASINMPAHNNPNHDDDNNLIAPSDETTCPQDIEERRKQRQERMAKYANRLAELKQDSSRVMMMESDDRNMTTLVRNSGDDSTPSSREAPSPRLPFYEGEVIHHLHGLNERDIETISTMTAAVPKLQKEDSLHHRDVDKVLLALLERANHHSSVMNRSSESSRASSSSSSREKRTGMASCAALQCNANRYTPPPIRTDLYDPVAVSRSASDGNHNGLNCFCDSFALQVVQNQSSSHSLKRIPSSSASNKTDSSRSRNSTSQDSHLAEISTTMDGVVAVVSDSSMMSELDDLVRKLSDRSHHSGVSSSSPVLHKAFDEKLRQLLGTTNSPQSRCQALLEEEDVDDGEEDNNDTLFVQSSSHVDRSTFECSIVESLLNDDEIDFDDDNNDDQSANQNMSTIDKVLGPLNKKDGGTTGVVLEPDLPKHRSRGSLMSLSGPSILESLSAAVSMVVSMNSAASNGGLFRDKYESQDDDDKSDSSKEVSQSNNLMMNICAHLLPAGASGLSKARDRIPKWDEENADEPGYRVVRLTKGQLQRVEEELRILTDKHKHNVEHHLLRQNGCSDEMFERDLQAAELDLLVNEATRRSSKNILGSSKPTIRQNNSISPDRLLLLGADDGNEAISLPDFPGVKRAGAGEMGDLEYFVLPIIFKSHVTGFEPTKELCLDPGNVIAGQYLVEGELGSAAFSTAYRCIDLNMQGAGLDGHEEVCLKVIKNTKDFFDQSLDEIKILELLKRTGKCREKRIVEMKTFFYHREHLIIVTELLRQNLFEFGKLIVENNEEPYFTLPRLAYITRQVLIALDFVHGLGLVHSDVKPENILLESYSGAKVKLIDFGSSCYLTDRQSSYIQSRSYRAPEVILGLPYDGRIDIWSLGCVIAEMYTGDVTFQNDSVVTMLSRIEAICGPFPRHMLDQGRQSGRYFTKCGLLYECVQQDPPQPHQQHSNTDDEAEVSLNNSGELEQQPKASSHYDIFQPKATTFAARLRIDLAVMDASSTGYGSGRRAGGIESIGSDSSISKRLALAGLDSGAVNEQRRNKKAFVDFVQKLLTIDPEVRLTAAQALQHPFMQYASTLTDANIKYPVPTMTGSV